MTRILGIDPGLTRCGIGVVDLATSRKVTLVEVDVFRSDPGVELVARVGSIGDRIEAAIEHFKPDAIAIERVFAQSNLRSVMGVAQISGVVLHLAHRYKIPLAFHTPTEVKAAVTGSGRADKAQVGYMVAKILGLDSVPKPADAADALAIAITHGWRSAGATGIEASNLTKAQQAWHTAAQAAAKKREG
ncbi:MAG: crossover junction endodeoxyribonuclease RuvC [Micrococcales bacterium]